LVSFFASDNPLIKVDQKRTSTPKMSPGRNEELVPIRSAVQAELAVYMRPSHIIPLDFLPLTLNGKIDGKKLLEVFQQTPLEDLMKLQRSDVLDRATLASREPTDVERNVISLVSRISGLPESQLSPASNLFECGFDSLRFSVLTRALRGEFTASALSVASIMQSPSIESIAEQCSETNGEDAVRRAGDLTWLEDFSRKHRSSVEQVFRKADVEQVLPTLPIQDGILVQSMQFKNLYVQHFLYRLKEGVDLDRLENAWKKVSGRQEILRYVFLSLLIP
jgi:aryl carrier-like protein